METLVIKRTFEKFVFFCKLGGIFQNKKMAMSEIKPGLLFMVPNLVYKFQIFAQWKLQLLNDNLRNLYFSALFWAYSRTNKNDTLV